jgi:hypothetical protein
MHPSLRVSGRLAVTVVRVAVGPGFGGWPPAEAVHEPEKFALCIVAGLGPLLSM